MQNEECRAIGAPATSCPGISQSGAYGKVLAAPVNQCGSAVPLVNGADAADEDRVGGLVDEIFEFAIERDGSIAQNGGPGDLCRPIAEGIVIRSLDPVFAGKALGDRLLIGR